MNNDPTKYPEWYKQFLRGVARVESAGGQLMMNPRSTATGLYGQLYSEVEGLPMLQGVSRKQFAADTALQNRIMEQRFEGNIPGVPGLMRNVIELTREYQPQLGEKFTFRPDEVAALTNFLGRQRTRKYFASIRDNKPFEVPGVNKTPEDYLKEYNVGFGDVPAKAQRSKQVESLLFPVLPQEGEMRFGGRVLKKKDYGQDGMLVQKDPTLVPDPPEDPPSDDVLARLSLGITPPNQQFRLSGGDAPFRTIKEQKDIIAEQESEGDIMELLRYLPVTGEAIDAYELGKVATTGEDIYGEKQDPTTFAAMTAAGYLIPNVLEKPLKSAWRAVKKFPAKMPKKEFRELKGPEKEQVRANLTQGHLETYGHGGYETLQSGARPVNVRQLPSLMSGSKLENAVGKDGMIQVSQIENLINSKDVSAAEKEALKDALFKARVQQGEAEGLAAGAALPDKIDYLSFKRAGSDAVSVRRGDAAFSVQETREYADYGISNLGLNIRTSTSRDMALADDVGLARTNLIRTTDPDLQSTEYGHFGEDVIGHYRTFEHPDEKGVLYISELQADPLQARGPAGQKTVGLNIGEGGPTAKQANLIKNQDQFLISHILEQEAKGADKLRFPTGETTSKIQGYGDIQRNVQHAQEVVDVEQEALDAMMVDLDTTTGKNVPSRLANRVEGMGLSGVDPDKALDFLGRVRAYRTRGGVPRDLASDPGIQYAQSVVEKFDNDALKQAYKEIKDQPPLGQRLKDVTISGGTLEEAAQNRAIQIKEDIHKWSEQLERIKTRKEHLERVNASTQATQGIMKGYDRLPKSLKKHGLDATKVTDDAGNTWWEVDIPARLGEGVGEVRAYRSGGQVSDKIRVLKREGRPQDQAVAIALAMQESGKL